MLGAIVGDVIGSVYERHPTKSKRFRLYHERDRATDDTVLTLAVASALLRSGGQPSASDYAGALRTFARRYPRAGYGGAFRAWVSDDGARPYGSWGNGSAMRVSPVGWAFDDEETVLREAGLTALPTHDHDEGVRGAQAVALAVLLARRGTGREAIRETIEARFGYDLSRTLREIRPAYRFDVSCRGSVPEALIAFLESVDFEEAIRNAISLGGDADTQACIAGAVAEAYYGGIPARMLERVVGLLDDFQLDVAREFHARYPSPASRRLFERRVDSAPQEAGYRVLLHGSTWQGVRRYARELESGPGGAGGRLAARLASAGGRAEEQGRGDAVGLLEELLNTKAPRVFAESEIVGDGRDWTPNELRLLGDVGVAVPVTVFDDGRHADPSVHERPFQATLLFVPGALLRNDRGQTPADATVLVDGRVDPRRYAALYERRLLPALAYASARSEIVGRPAVVTIPGLGCGQFAGRFRGTLGALLSRALRGILERNAALLRGIRAVWFDPYDECADERHDAGGIRYLVRPLRRSANPRPQLCPTCAYEEDDDDYDGCDLYSVVAWDHVSWPGNDFYAGSRSTDDGVKAAATNAMEALTGRTGSYDRARHAYLPPEGFASWEEVVRATGVMLRTDAGLVVVDQRDGGR